MSPPTDSTASAISTALRRSVPLNRRCSRKWLAPARCSGSSRDPVPTQHPTATDRSAGRRSVTSLRPEPSTVFRMGSGAIIAPVIGSAKQRVEPRSAASAAATASAATAAPGAAVATALTRPAGRLLGTELPELRAGLVLPVVLEGRDVATAALTVPGGADSGRDLGPLTGSVTGRGAPTVGVPAHEAERQLARVVDVVDPHGQFVAEVEHVLDPLDPLPTSELGDVEEAVTAREDVDEGAELRDVHDLAGVLGPELGG